MSDIIGPREPLEWLGLPIEFAGPTRWECFSDFGVRTILEALALTAPRLVDDVVVVTSSYRPGGDGSRFSWHQRAAAVDVRTGITRNERAELVVDGRRGALVGSNGDQALRIGRAWKRALEARLGNTFDVVFGDDPSHFDHIHIELDGSKRRGTR